MEFTVDFENNTIAENNKISKVFSKQVFQNTHLIEQFDDYESYIVECIKNTFHVLKMQHALGKSSRVKDNDSFCIFCNESMKQNEFKRVLSCGHEYHKKCIDKWIFKYYSSFCPCCKKEIV